MPQDNQAELNTAKEIVHDVEVLRKSKEFKRYVLDYLEKQKDQALDNILGGLTHENYLIELNAWNIYTHLLLRHENDWEINSKLIEDYNKAHAEP